jgi:hypothetical protein
MIKYGFEFTQSFATARVLIVTFGVNKMKKIEKMKPPLAEHLQKYKGFQNFPPAKTARYPVSGEVLVNRKNASNFIISILFICF